MKRFALAILIAVAATASFAQSKPKAVLINGFKLSEAGWCKNVNTQMNQMGQYLSKKGYAVHSFAPPVRDYPAIGEAMNGASIVVYWGHGVIQGSGTFAPQNANVGGFSIDGRHITSDGLRREVRLAQNAIVILPNSCYAAGNSSDDNGKVSRNVLEQRMTNYAEPFTEMGAQAIASCVQAQSFLATWLDTGNVETAYSKSKWSNTVVKKKVGRYEFWYGERNGKCGLSTTSALFWRK